MLFLILIKSMVIQLTWLISSISSEFTLHTLSST